MGDPLMIMWSTIRIAGMGTMLRLGKLIISWPFMFICFGDEGATDEHVEVYQDKLTNKQMADGFLPWTDTFDLDEFYQYPIDKADIKKTAAGWTINKVKRTLIRKHKPSHQL